MNSRLIARPLGAAASVLLAGLTLSLACSPDGGDSSGGDDGAGGAVSGAGGADPGAGGSPALPPFDAGTDPNRNNVVAGNVCERLATIQCAGERHCCVSPGRTFDECKATQLKGCKEDAFLDAITLEAQAGFDAATAAAAFTEFERLSSTCDVTVGPWATTAAGLRGIVRGTRAYGTSCQPTVIGANAATAAFLASCSDPATTACLPTLTSWQCSTRAAASGQCFTDVNCQDGLYCPNPKLDIAGARCTARKADGQPCKTGNECASFACVNDACVTATTQTAYCLPPP